MFIFHVLDDLKSESLIHPSLTYFKIIQEVSFQSHQNSFQ